MKQEFIIKMQGKQFEKGRAHVYIMLLCFVLAMVILMIYSSKYFIALLAPIFWLLLRLKNISTERKYITDVICEVEVLNDGMAVTLRSTQSRLCNSFFVDYSKVQDAQIADDGKVSISFLTSKGKEDIWTFYPMANNLDFWKKELSKFYS